MDIKEILYFSLACFTIIVTLDICPDAINSVLNFFKGVVKNGKHEQKH